MKVRIQRDQAVWERETFEVEVPDGWDMEDLEVLEDAINNFDGYEAAGYSKEILDPVLSIDTETVFFDEDGEEYSL